MKEVSLNRTLQTVQVLFRTIFSQSISLDVATPDIPYLETKDNTKGCGASMAEKDPVCDAKR